MNPVKFCDLARGTHFKHGGRAYLKLGQNLARNEWQKRTLFPSELVVEPCQTATPSSKPETGPAPA
jgi:hypothetical protein